MQNPKRVRVCVCLYLCVYLSVNTEINVSSKETKRCCSCQTQDHPQRRAKERKEEGKTERASWEHPSLGAGSCSHIFWVLQPEDGCPAGICKSGFLVTPGKWKWSQVLGTWKGHKERGREVSLGRKGPAWGGSFQLAWASQSVQTDVVLLIPIWGSMRRNIYLLLNQAWQTDLGEPALIRFLCNWLFIRCPRILRVKCLSLPMLGTRNCRQETLVLFLSPWQDLYGKRQVNVRKANTSI